MKKPRKRNVLVCLAYAFGEAHEKHRGIMKYLLSEGDGWNVLTPYDRCIPSAADIAAAKRGGLDGILLDLNIPRLQPKHVATVLRAGVPVVCLESDASLGKTAVPVAHVRSSDSEIGTLAADHLAAVGAFASYAFVGSPEGDWSVRRGEAFARRLRKLGKPPPEILSDGFAPLSRFLGQLAKPCAVFVAADYVATRVLSEARRLGLDVPVDLAVVGVDNERLICTNVEPTLTSIQPNFFREGFVAAGLLARLMRGQAVRPVPECRGARLFIRGSTGPSGPGGRLAQKAADFLSANFTERVDVEEIARRLNVSRRLLDKRYRQFTGESIMETVERLRIERVKELLLSTNSRIGEIAAECGFSSVNFMRRVFLRHFRDTPLAFRKRHAR